MKTGNVILIIVVLIAVGIVIYFVIKKLREGLQNFVSSTPAGWIGGVRSVEGEKAFKDIMAMKFLTEAFYEKSEKKYNTINYKLDYMGTDKSNELAQQVKNSHARILSALFSDSEKALSAILQIQNIVQASEVTRSFYLGTRKNLNAGLNWLSDETLIAARDHFNSLPVGIYDKVNDEYLSREQIGV